MKTAFDIIQVLRAFFNDECVERDEKSCLWDVLTALRGPDDFTLYNYKARYTAYIRGYIFGPCLNYGDVASEGPDPYILRQEVIQLFSYRNPDSSMESHFLYHIKEALRRFNPEGITPHPNFRTPWGWEER